MLKAIAYDFNEQLYVVASFIDGKSAEELQKGSVRLATARFWLVCYTDENKYPVELPEFLQAEFGKNK